MNRSLNFSLAGTKSISKKLQKKM